MERQSAIGSRQSGFDAAKDGQVLAFGLKLKARLIEIGRTAGRARCPASHPDGAKPYVHMRLVGPKKHLRLWCDDPNCHMRMME